MQPGSPLLQEARSELGYDAFRWQRRDCRLEIGERKNEALAEVIELGVSLANVHVAPLRWQLIPVSHASLGWGNTHSQGLDLDDPYDEGADVGSTAIDDGMVDNLHALCPARVVAIVALDVLVIPQRDGAWRERVGRDVGSRPLVRSAGTSPVGRGRYDGRGYVCDGSGIVVVACWSGSCARDGRAVDVPGT